MRHLVSFTFVLGLFTLYGCGNNSNQDSIVPPITKQIPKITPTTQQKERRARSEEYCKIYKIPYFSDTNYFYTETDDKVRLRTKEEVINRALALYFVGIKSEGIDEAGLKMIDSIFSISSILTPEEKRYINSAHPTQQQKTDANWRYESMHVMLWALGFIDSLSYPAEMCDVSEDSKIFYELRNEGFRSKAKLRSKKEILDQADLVVRLHWACVQSQLKNQPPPAGLNTSVIYERHYSLNWLIRYMNQEWDNVQTDT